MRKWNTILSVLMLLIFMIHGIMGSFMLNGVGSSAGNFLHGLVLVFLLCIR